MPALIMKTCTQWFVTFASLAVCLLGATPAVAEDKSPGWIILFDGKITDKLRGYKQTGFPDKAWVVDNGALKTITKEQGGTPVDLVTIEKYKNFELEYEWKVSPGGNSGVLYRVAEGADRPPFSGPEMQVLDDATHKDGANPKTSSGALYALMAPSADRKVKPVGEFNHAKIIARGKHVEHWLNGVKVVEYEWNSPAIKALVEESKFKGKAGFMAESEGLIDFQHHGQEVWFRNMRVRRLAE